MDTHGKIASNYLTQRQQEALDMKRERSIGKTVTAWVQLAESRGCDDDTVLGTVEKINTLPGGQLKKLRKSLVAALRVEEFIEFPKVPSLDSIAKMALVESENNPPASIENLTYEDVNSYLEREMMDVYGENSEPAVGYAALVDGASAAEPSASAEEVGMNVELSESVYVKTWVAKILGDSYETDGKAVSEIARCIYEAAGSPRVNRGKNGSQPDPIARIQLRLKGYEYAEIAAPEQLSGRNMAQWFSQLVVKAQKLHSAPDDELIDNTPRVQEEQAVKPALEADAKTEEPLEPAETPFLVTRAVTPATVKWAAKIEKHEEVDHKELAKRWAKEMGFDDDEDIEALEDMFNPEFMLEQNSVHKKVLNRLRVYIKDNIPNIQDDEYELGHNQLTRVNKMFGRERTADGDTYNGQPLPVREVCLDRDYFVDQRRGEILSALSQLLGGSDRGIDSQDNEPITEELLGLLKKQGFSPEEVDHLVVCIRFDKNERYKERPETTKAALRKLQKLLMDKGQNLDDADRRVRPSLNMLTNVATGVSTIQEIYAKLHSLDADITKEDVETLLEEGIATLVR